jgi:hypothetical protein
MTGSPAWSAIPWLIRDTFRQALAAGIFWLMLGVSALTVVACLSVEVVGDAPPGTTSVSEADFIPQAQRVGAARCLTALVSGAAAQAHGAWPVPSTFYASDYLQLCLALRQGPPPRGQLRIAGGLLSMDIREDRARAVHTLQLQLAGWIADAGGLLLALVWTAGFLPTFLDASAVAVLLAKPLSRWLIVTGKFLGVFVFVAFQSTVFVIGTWLALGCRTGVWDLTYLLCIPVLLIHFAVFFSFSAMLATATRSTTACVFGSVVFWMLCWAMNFGRHISVLITELQGTTPVFGHTLELGYWILPKPLDFHIVLLDLLQADNLFVNVIDTCRLVAQGAWSPVASMLASVACAGVLLFVAVYDFGTAEY